MERLFMQVGDCGCRLTVELFQQKIPVEDIPCLITEYSRPQGVGIGIQIGCTRGDHIDPDGSSATAQEEYREKQYST
jgi:hypothetical protein